MSGSLVLVDEFTTSSAVASVTIGGGSSGSSSYNYAIDTTYNVYLLEYTNVGVETNSRNVCVRVTKSGTADATANYDYSYIVLNAGASTGSYGTANENEWTYLFADNIGTATGEVANGTAYLFNFPNTGEYSFITADMVEVNNTPVSRGNTGAGVHTTASASDGLYFFDDAGGNIASGSSFKLYGIKK